MKTVREILNEILLEGESIERRCTTFVSAYPAREDAKSKAIDDLCSAVDGLKPRDDKSLTIAVYIQALEDVKAMIRSK